MSEEVTPELPEQPIQPHLEPEPEHIPLAKRFPRIAKFFRLLKYFILSAIILTVMEIGVGYWLFSSRWNLLIEREKMQEFAEEVNNATPVHPKYLEVYTKLYPNHVNTTLGQQIFINYAERYFFRVTDIDDKPHCFCDMVYDIMEHSNYELDSIEWDGRMQDLEFGFGIEKFSTPEKCFQFVTNWKIANWYNRLDPNKFGHLVNKSLDNYTDEDFMELILIMTTLNEVNRYKNPRKFEKKMAHYRERLRKAREAEKAKAGTK